MGLKSIAIYNFRAFSKYKFEYMLYLFTRAKLIYS